MRIVSCVALLSVPAAALIQNYAGSIDATHVATSYGAVAPIQTQRFAFSESFAGTQQIDKAMSPVGGICPKPRDYATQSCVNTPNGIAKATNQCYALDTNDSTYQQALAKLTMALLKTDPRQPPYTGCTTYPYRADIYQSVAPTVNLLVHAGLDLRASGTEVFAIEDGKIVAINYCFGQDRSRCTSTDGLDHSTLIIENGAGTRKVIYLHMKDLPAVLRKGNSVSAGQLIGTAWNVGSTASHLHIEVWPSSSPSYLETSALSGRKCGTVCDDAQVALRTSDPLTLVPASIALPTCTQEQALKSMQFDKPASVVFTNSSAHLISIFWLNYAGHRVLYNRLGPGQSYVQRTFLTHPWVATDASGRCLKVHLPAPQITNVTIQ